MASYHQKKEQQQLLQRKTKSVLKKFSVRSAYVESCAFLYASLFSHIMFTLPRILWCLHNTKHFRFAIFLVLSSEELVYDNEKNELCFAHWIWMKNIVNLNRNIELKKGLFFVFLFLCKITLFHLTATLSRFLSSFFPFSKIFCFFTYSFVDWLSQKGYLALFTDSFSLKHSKGKKNQNQNSISGMYWLKFYNRIRPFSLQRKIAF